MIVSAAPGSMTGECIEWWRTCKLAGEVESVDMPQACRQSRVLSGHRRCWVRDWMRRRRLECRVEAGVEGKQLKAGGKTSIRSQQ